jgi:exportin-2 (importin alpha re-exporter)
MRVIITARQAMTPIHATVLQHLTNIMGEISKNPSNPKFNHYTFESMSALVRFVVAGTPSTLPEFEAALFPPFQYILAQDVSGWWRAVGQSLCQRRERR